MSFLRPGTHARAAEKSATTTTTATTTATSLASSSSSAAVERVAANREEAGVSAVFNRFAHYSLQQQRQALPIYQHRTELLYLVEHHETVIVVGETGSGKTTQLPQYLHEAGWTSSGLIVACTQPRRVAAMTVAARCAEELGCAVGGTVGYAVRFDDRTSASQTRVKYMTDGLLVRETLVDPLLSRYAVIMVDEAHERSVYTDILLGLLKKIQRTRKELRVIISSATLDADRFLRFFNQRIPNSASDIEKGSPPMRNTAVIAAVQGRTFPVTVHYLRAPTADYLESAVSAAVQIHRTQPRNSGDILMFLTGQEEITECVRRLADRVPDGSLLPLPLYGSLSPRDQMQAFFRAPDNTRKVVVATNIAEASVTIEGIVYVIDSLFVKLKCYSPKTNAESLVITGISKASAQQRAGRAGRMSAGHALRLCTPETYETLAPQTIPEMQRSNMNTVVLQLKALGIANIVRFDYVTAPPAEVLARSLELLYALGALDDDGALTRPLGEQLVELPLDPMMGRALLASGQFGCSEEMLSIAALMQVQGVFGASGGGRPSAAADCERSRFTALEGDHLSLLNAYRAFQKVEGARHAQSWCGRHYLSFRALSRASEIRAQLVKYLKKCRIPLVSCAVHAGDEDESDIPLRKCLAAGFFSQAARLHADGKYRSARNDTHILAIHPSSIIATERPPKWVVYHEEVHTDQHYMRDVTAIEPDWLTELAPHFYKYDQVAPKRQRL